MSDLRMERVAVVGDDYFWNDDPAPRDMVGRCKECRQPHFVGHLGSCSHSWMRGGSGPTHMRRWVYRYDKIGATPGIPDGWALFIGDPVQDRDRLINLVDRCTTEALHHFGRGYGPRLWLRYWRKKRIASALRELLHEADLSGRTGGLAP